MELLDLWILWGPKAFRRLLGKSPSYRLKGHGARYPQCFLAPIHISNAQNPRPQQLSLTFINTIVQVLEGVIILANP